MTPDQIAVEVWDYEKQRFIACIRCPGESRVRVDYHGPLENLAVFPVNRLRDGRFEIASKQPLDWQISYS